MTKNTMTKRKTMV